VFRSLYSQVFNVNDDKLGLIKNRHFSVTMPLFHIDCHAELCTRNRKKQRQWNDIKRKF